MKYAQNDRRDSRKNRDVVNGKPALGSKRIDRSENRKLLWLRAGALLTCAASTFSVAFGQKTIDSEISGRHDQFRLNFPIKRPKHTPPYDWKQIGAMMDALEEGVRDDGTVVIKRPDIWSQARMSDYRVEFDKQFSIIDESNKFQSILAGRIARSDQQQFQSSTTVTAALGAISARGNSRLPFLRQPGSDASAAQLQEFMNAQKAQTDLLKSESDLRKALSEERISQSARDKALIDLSKTALNSGELSKIEINNLFKLLNTQGETLSGVGEKLKFGIDPTVYLDEKKRYIDHLHQIRRVNLGDDMADSAGYSLYLTRLPASIQPGSRTLAGHGALLNVTVKPEFNPSFLEDTFRNLVVTDVADLLTPMVYTIMERNLVEEFAKAQKNYEESKRQVLNFIGANKHVFFSEIKDSIFPFSDISVLNTDESASNEFERLYSFKDAGQFGEAITRLASEMTRRSQEAKATKTSLEKIKSLADDGFRKADMEFTKANDALKAASAHLIELKYANANVDSIKEGLDRNADEDAMTKASRQLEYSIARANKLPALDIGTRSELTDALESEGKSVKLTYDTLTRKAEIATMTLSNAIIKLQSDEKQANELLAKAKVEKTKAVIALTRAKNKLDTSANSLKAYEIGLGSITSVLTNTSDLSQNVSSIIRSVGSIQSTFSSVDPRKSMIVPPVDIDDVYFPGLSLLLIAERYSQTVDRKHASVSELRGFLIRHLQASYDYVKSHPVILNPASGQNPVSITQYLSSAFVAARDRNTWSLNEDSIKSLFNKFQLAIEPNVSQAASASSLHPVFCWSIVVDSGLLNERIKEEMERMNGREGFQLPVDHQNLRFYSKFDPADQDYLLAADVFQSFVKARWPVICFALDPVTDQQNIGDSSSLRRDMELVLSVALANGQISASQFNRFRRAIGMDSETINLNRTVTAFAHSNDTFGWRFYPRFQTPPVERSNIESFANQMIYGGPPRNYQLKNAKLEAGQRELTAVMILPSFLQQVRFEVNTNWFPLHRPDNMTIPNTRILWQGQQLQEVRKAMDWLCDHNDYRPGDIERILVKLDQVEKMLPMQTEVIRIPYENNQGGYDLFTPGLSALGPVLIGAEGVNTFPDDKFANSTVVAFGKNLSLTGTEFIMGGKQVESLKIISREIVELTIPGDSIVSTSKDGKRLFLELRAITPTGISNVIEVPVSTSKAKEVQKKASDFQMIGKNVNVLVSFADSGPIASAIIEGSGNAEMKVKDNTNRVVRDIPAKIRALRLDFYQDGELKFSESMGNLNVNSFNAQGESDLSGTVTALLTGAIKAKSKILRSEFKEGTSYIVKGAILLLDDPLAIPLDGEFKVVLKAKPVPQSSTVAPPVPIQNSSSLESMNGAAVGADRKAETNEGIQVLSSREATRLSATPETSPFSGDFQSHSNGPPRPENKVLRFKDLVHSDGAEEPEFDSQSKSSQLPPALTPPADELIERQSFVLTQPVPANPPKSSLTNARRSENTAASQHSRPITPYSSSQINAAQKTGIPLPKP